MLVFTGLAVVGMAACFNPRVGNCAVQCGDQESCPTGTSCLSDGICHASPDESLCTTANSDAATVDAQESDARPFDAAPGCGDGIIDPGNNEACDDFNEVSGDGCSDVCVVETGFICLGAPSDCAQGPGPGELVITEIQKDPCADQGSGCTVLDNRGEWFEVLNTTSTRLQLLNMEIKDQGQESIMVTIPLIIAPNQSLVFGNATMAQNGGAQVDYVYPSIEFSLANGADEVVLVNSLTLLEVDHVNYNDANFPDTRGASLSLDPGFYNSTDNDVGANWCDGDVPYGSGDLGTPGLVNPTCP